MRILDIIRGHMPKATHGLELDPERAADWPKDFVERLGIGQSFEEFKAHVAQLHQQINTTLSKFASEDVLAAIPDRARTMNALHGQEYSTQVRKLLKTTEFDDLFQFEKQQDAYFEANSAFQELTSKNTSVLKEFLHDELKATQALLQQLEDAVIGILKTLEDLKFPQVRKLKDLGEKTAQVTQRGEKYRQLLTSLSADLKRTGEKRAHLENDIKAQEALIRNEQALESLQKSNRIEEELHGIAVKYASACDDLRGIYRKHPDVKLTPKLKHVIDELPKDPLQFICEEAENARAQFEASVQQLEEENPGNVKGIITRLSKLAKEVEADARKVQTLRPDQKALKRDIMKDIAALNIYDKQQFLLRAKTEEDILRAKITYLEAELDPSRPLAMLQEMKAIAHDLGAKFKDEPEETPEEKKAKDEAKEGVDAEEKESEEPAKKDKNPKGDVAVTAEEQRKEDKEKQSDKRKKK